MLDHLAPASPGVTGYEQRQKPNVEGLVPTALKCPAHPRCQVHPKQPPDGKCHFSCFYHLRKRCTGVAHPSSAHATPARASVRLQPGPRVHQVCHCSAPASLAGGSVGGGQRLLGAHRALVPTALAHIPWKDDLGKTENNNFLLRLPKTPVSTQGLGSAARRGELGGGLGVCRH